MILIITVKNSNPQKNTTIEKTPHIIVINYIKIQNIYKESSQPKSAMETWKFPPNHKIQPGTIIVSPTPQIQICIKKHFHKSIIFVMLVRRVIFFTEHIH